MFKRVLVVMVMLLVVFNVPVALGSNWSGNGAGGGFGAAADRGGQGVGGGFSAASSNANVGTSGVATAADQSTANAGETQQLGVTTQDRQETGQCVKGTTAAAVCERLQTMLRERNMTKAVWQEVCQNLDQLREQYRTRTEERAEIQNAFKLALQLAKEQNNTQETEQLLRDMIAMEPDNPETYKELGSLFQKRGDTVPKMWCGGNEMKTDVPAVIKQGRTLIPVRAISEALGAMVQWREAEQKILISKGETQIQLQVNNQIALINGRQVELEVVPEVTSARVLVPLRFIAECFNAKVGFYQEGSIITVNQ